MQTVEDADESPWFEQKPDSNVFFDGAYGAFSVTLNLTRLRQTHFDTFPLLRTENDAGRIKLRMASQRALYAFQAFAQVINVDWFRRIWVIQEVVFAKHAVVLLGSASIPWEVLSMAATVIEMHTECCKASLSTFPELARLIEDFTLKVGQISWTRLKRRILDSPESIPLYDLLWQYRCHQATDPRDKIYALLGFLTEDARGELVPDYTLSKKEVYKRAVLQDVRATKTLKILKGHRSVPADLPSWIYDWAAPMELTDWHWERQRLRNGEYSASGHEDACLHCDNNYKLSLGGIYLDTVTTVGRHITKNTCVDAVTTWLQIVDLPSRNTDPYIGGGDYQCAFWRTLTRDLFLKDSKFERLDDPESYVAAAKIWWGKVINSNY